MKKIACFLLTVIMMAAIAVPALAADVSAMPEFLMKLTFGSKGDRVAGEECASRCFPGYVTEPRSKSILS